MRKLLIATDGFLPRWDGISSFLDEIIPRLEKHYDITVLAPDQGPLNVKYKAKIIRFKTVKMRLADNYYPCVPNFFEMRKEIRKTDVVWVQAIGPIGLLGILLGNFYRKPVAFYNHMIEWEVFPKSQGLNILKVPINVMTKLVGKFLYNRCSVIMVSSVEYVELLKLIGIKNIKKVVHLGVDTQHYKPSSDKGEAKKRLGIEPSFFVVGYAGRVSLEKDTKTLYRAYLRLSKKHKDVFLLIAGGGRPELEEMFINKKNVIITGSKDDLAPYYQAMDVYVLSSLVETTSLTTMEAMASGCAVVATPVGFVKEYINDGTNGMFFPKKNSYELFRKLEYLKEHPKDVKSLGEKARETMCHHYNWDKTAKGIIEIIDNVK